CGSGRDSLYFKNKGYYVDCFDASSELVNRCQSLGLNAKLDTFESFNTETKFDGIWACASLLHLNKSELPTIIQKLLSFLETTGVFYLSFKHGQGEELKDGRYFQMFDEESFAEVIKEMKVETITSWSNI